MKFEFEYFSYSVYLGCIYICCVNNVCDIVAEPYNIALRKPTNQGPADYCIGGKGCCTSDLAVDGKLGQKADNRQCSHTKANGSIQGSWWSVDFQGDDVLALIRILRRSNLWCCKGRMNRVSIKGKPGNQTIFSDGNPFSVYNKKDIRITVPDSLSDTKFTGINISIPGQFLTLCEVQVYSGRSCGINLPILTNGNWTSSNTISNCYFYGCSYTGNCATGYTQSGTITTTCSESGSWTTPVGRCNARPCGSDLPAMSNGKWISQGTGVSCYYYTCSYSFSCKEGYAPSGTNPIIAYCGSDGKWTKYGGSCLVRSCSSTLPVLSNGIWTPRNSSNCFTYTCSYAFSCTQGYAHDGTIPIITSCSSVGIWTAPAGTCQVIECPVLNGNHTNYVVTSSLERTTYNTQLTAACRHGYELSSGDLNRTCLANGTWSGTEPNCTIITCTRPQYEGMNNIIKNETTNFIYEDLLASQCIEGFELLVGNLTRYCLASGQWSGEAPNCTAIRPPDESSSDNVAALGGSVGGVIAAIVAVVIVVVVVFRRRNRQKLKGDTSYQSNKTYRLQAEKLDNIEERVYSNVNTSYENTLQMDTGGASGYSYVDNRKMSLPEDKCSTQKENDLNEAQNVRPEEYYNVSSFDKKSCTVIMLDNLTDFVLAGKTTYDIMESEFKKFPSGLVESHKTALQPANRKKNRYRLIYAYDDTRVVLTDCKDAADTDYINASYIHGFDAVRAYIASQGPTKDMMNDFWRMVWQQNSSKIVMLTNLEEDSKMKCLQYWPDEGSHQYGSFTVTIRDTEIYSDFVIRTMGIKQGQRQERVVYQFHFTAWPDKGVPKFSSAIVNFRNKVRNKNITEAGPTVVHCSAGIGRTGTYIALDILTEQGSQLGYVDVVKCVGDLRRQRVNMIQTLDQYVFLHSALTEALMLSSSATSAAKFPELYRELLQVDPVKRKRNIEATFDMLKNMSPVVDENQYSCAREVRNRKRNRYSNVLPVSEFIPPLLGSSKDRYINAVYLPSYKEKKALILTQMPLKETKSDFWALVQAQNVRTVVMMNTIAEVERDEVYWPDLNETLSFNNVDIETVEVEKTGQHKVVTMKMNDKYLEFDRTVKLIQCVYWPPSQRLPKSPSDILETMDLVQTFQQQSGNNPIAVHCMNGVDRSGLFCVMYAVIERLKIEQDVAITQVIEQMRCCRDQIIPSLEQFQFCHEVVLTYIQQFSEYSNFSVQ